MIELDFNAKLALLDDPATDDATLLEVITPEDRTVIFRHWKDACRRSYEASQEELKALADQCSYISKMRIEESPRDVIGNWLGIVSDDERMDRMWARSQRDDAARAQKLDQIEKKVEETGKALILWSNRYLFRLPKRPDGSDDDLVSNSLADFAIGEAAAPRKSKPKLATALKIGGALGVLAYLATR